MQTWIGLGGNEGDVRGTFASALRSLTEQGAAALAVSRVYRTRPIGPRAGGAFLNACAALETELEPAELLPRLQGIEDEAGRRREGRWHARPLDLDVLLYDGLEIRTDALQIPHPGVSYRRFVLDPLAEIAGEVRVPGPDRSVIELRERLTRRPLPVGIAGGTAAERLRLREMVSSSYPLVAWHERRTVSDDDSTIIRIGSSPPAEEVPRGAGPSPVVVGVDARLGSLESAVAAVLDALLDEPECIGPLELG